MEQLRRVAKLCIQNDIQPKITKLKVLIQSSSSVPNAQPYVQKVKEIKPDIEVIKTIIPPLDKMPAPEKTSDPLTSLKKIIEVIIFEYELVLSVAMDVADVATDKDVVKLVSTLKVLKPKLNF